MRCVTSNRSCRAARDLGSAITIMTANTVTMVAMTSVWACDTAPASHITDTAKARYQIVPATALPTCRPPKW
jgi:hypothetical protein